MIEELWSNQDAQSLQTLTHATERESLLEAMLALAGCDPIDSQQCLDQVTLWSEMVQHQLDSLGGNAPILQLRALVEVLVEGLDFQGDAGDYYNPNNSLLPRVLQRRRGLPITLSALWIAVGHRAGLDIEGVGLPGHFIVRIGGDDGGIYADPFYKGRLLSTQDCKNIVTRLCGKHLAWSDEFLDPIPPSKIIERMVHNLINSHNRTGNRTELYRSVRVLCGLSPSNPVFRLLLGHVAEEIGAPALALDSYTRIMREFPQTQHARQAQKRLHSIQNQAQYLN